MRVLVTGGAGFLGSHVVAALRRSGHAPVALDDLSTGCRDAVASDVPLVVADVRSAVAVGMAIARTAPDAVVHLAALPFDPVGGPSSSDVVDVNVVGAVRVAEESGAVPHLVFASSAAVYGELSGSAAGEDHPTCPISANGVAKLAVEGFLRARRARHGTVTAVLRFANLYGNGSAGPGASAIGAFLERLSLDESPEIDDDGRQTRDFVYVEDAADAVVRAIESRLDGTYNVGTGIETSILDLARMVSDSLGVDPPSPRFRPARPNDVRRSCLDGARLDAATGFRPMTDLATGLAATVATRRATILQH